MTWHGMARHAKETTLAVETVNLLAVEVKRDMLATLGLEHLSASFISVSVP